MRLSELLISQRREDDPAADLLTRAGYIHRLAEGLYTLLPLGHRVVQRIQAIVRRQMSRLGAQELTMPLLQPSALWDRRRSDGESRAESFGTQLFRLAGDGGDPLVLAPTHEEVAAILAAACIRDRRDLPRIIYQIQPRFRHQTCPVADGGDRLRPEGFARE